MAAFMHPGVYVLETPSPARSIEAASTSTCIFVGDAERGPLTPVKITSRGDYTRQYGSHLRNNSNGTTGYTMAYAMDAFFGNGGTTCYMLRVAAPPQSGSIAIASRTVGAAKVVASSPGVWATGTATGQGVFAIFLNSTDQPAASNPTTFRIVVVYMSPESGNPPVQQIVEDWDRLSTNPNDENYVVDVLKRSLYIRWDANTPAAIPTTMDIAPAATNPSADTILSKASTAQGIATGLTGGVGGETEANSTDYDLSLLDDIDDASILLVGHGVKSDSLLSALNTKGIAYVGARPMRDLFFIGALQRHGAEALAQSAVSAVISDYASLVKTDFAAFYFPWIYVSDPVGVGQDPLIAVSPAATMAGVYARTDALRGVWKAPAGVEAGLLGCRKIEFNIQDIHQDQLNPLGINALRNMAGAGPVSWGARTMRPSSEWRYINVRRMAIFLRKSIYNGIQFAVFEGNDEPLWASLRLTIGGFMDSLYRQGAFAGGSPSEAYFVKCDSETTTPTDQLAGVCNVLVGFSPLRPAEFVVVKLSQIVRSGA